MIICVWRFRETPFSRVWFLKISWDCFYFNQTFIGYFRIILKFVDEQFNLDSMWLAKQIDIFIVKQIAMTDIVSPWKKFAVINKGYCIEFVWWIYQTTFFCPVWSRLYKNKILHRYHHKWFRIQVIFQFSQFKAFVVRWKVNKVNHFEA